jgi:tetratricopeptide (TPR) repeat protein
VTSTEAARLIRAAEVEHDLGRDERALEYASQALRLDPDDAGALRILSAALRGLGRVPEALDAARHAVSSEPGNVHALDALTLSRSAARDQAGAIETARARVALDPRAWAGYVILAEVMTEPHPYLEGIDAARTAVELAPDEALAHVALGNALYRCHRKREAREHYQRALAIDPRQQEAMIGLSGSRLAADPGGAALGFSEVLADDPQYALAVVNLRIALARIFGISFFVVLGASFASLVVCFMSIGAKPVLSAVAGHLILGLIALVTLGWIASLLARLLRSGRVSRLLRFAAQRDRPLVVYGSAIALGALCIALMPVLPFPWQAILFVLLFILWWVTVFSVIAWRSQINYDQRAL